MAVSFRAIGACTFLFLWMATPIPRARAQGAPSDHAVAESLFDEGRKLLDEGRLEEACAKLDASNRMDPAVGTLLNLGDCYERRGRLASAWSTYRAAASLALSRSDARADFARKRSESVQPRLSTLTVIVLNPEPGLRVKRDGVPIDDAAWGTALPIDPGPHVLEAQAPGKKTWTTKITIAEGPPSSSQVKVEALTAAGAPGSTTAPSDASIGAPNPSRDAESTSPVAPTAARGGALRTLGFVVVGVGALTLGTSGFFAFHANSKWSDAQPHCDPSNRCDQMGVDLDKEARRSGDWATVTFTTGLILAAAGTLLIVFAPSRSAP